MERKTQHRLFFSGIAGSGMLPLALISQARGQTLAGSDRNFDQGKNLNKHHFLRNKGIHLYPQDGSGLKPSDTLVISTAVEDTTPDVAAAKALNCPILKRADLLASLVNDAPQSVAVAGTSGKSTTTGMLAHICCVCGLNPTVMNGAVMKNFVTPSIPFASAYIGGKDLFISECDESDGSIALYQPTIGILNNIALDHKDMDTLQALFKQFLAACEKRVINADCPLSAALSLPHDTTYGLGNSTATLNATGISHTQYGSTCRVNGQALTLSVPGNHNISNALAALGASMQLGVSLEQACLALASFTGMKRRLDIIGTTQTGITVIDDFAHNPDKIAASLDALHLAPGRLLILFQMHGFGTLKLLKDSLIKTFKTKLRADDLLYLPEALYFGGTVSKDVTMHDIAKALGVAYYTDRDKALPDMLKAARAGDRIVVMGARDDGLSLFAQDLMQQLGA